VTSGRVRRQGKSRCIAANSILMRCLPKNEVRRSDFCIFLLVTGRK
jgi:hypothetical protein